VSASRQRVAVVAPFFGAELRGRRERFTYAFVTHLALEGVAVEVITTTARADAPDQNAYRAGIDNTEPFPIHRFRIVAPDRAAYAEAVLAVHQNAEALWSRERALVEERLRSPGLVAHLRAVADAYDAFLFFDATAWTTVRGIAEVAETALLVPLLDDDPLVRLPAVAQAVAAARLILATSEAEAAMVADAFGPQARHRTRIVGLAADAVPLGALDAERVARAARHRPYLLASGGDRGLSAELRAGGLEVVQLEDADERDRAALFVGARAVALTGDGLGVVPELIEAWHYGRFALVSAASPGAAVPVRETGAGSVVATREEWAEALRALPPPEVLAARARAGTDYAAAHGTWPRVAQRTSEAIDEMAALDDGRPRAALRAQIAYLYPLVQRQRRIIEAMRVSRFWRLRDAWFAVRRRVGITTAADPIPVPGGGEGGVELAAMGDPYQLFREQHRLRREDVERFQTTLRFLPRTIRFGLVVDIRGRDLDGVRPALRSLRDQVYPYWTARILVGGDLVPEQLAELHAIAAEDPRLTLVEPGGEWFGDAAFVGPLDPHDRLEPHALFECALALQDDDVDVVYSDEDRLDELGVPRQPWFKPDWSPETLLTRDYVGRLCLVRRRALDEVGGVHDVVESARWYDALLRVTERTERIHHVAQVLYHRSAANGTAVEDLALAAEVALRRRGERAEVAVTPAGAEIRFAGAGERVTVVIPTRDRPELLSACLESLFTRTAYPAFDVVVIDNDSRLPETHELLANWLEREPRRFRVLSDPAPFNYSALNNRAIATVEAPYVVLLNNDTEVIAPDWMEAMLGQARRPAIGAVGALLLYDDDTVQHAGVIVGILGLAGHAHRFFPAGSSGYHGAMKLDTNYLAVTGACLMIARAKYLEVGGLDEELAVSSNDVDLCLKLYAAGYRNVVVPRAVLRHKESKTRGGDDTPAKIRRTMREIGLIRSRWTDLSARDPYYNPNLTADAEDFEVQL
jgi:GT2 family glycosyltransferase